MASPFEEGSAKGVIALVRQLATGLPELENVIFIDAGDDDADELVRKI
jgi:hypothetical protein